jgi:hypothetical protein
MAEPTYERLPVEVDLSAIMRAWAKDFTHEDAEIVGTDYYIDVHRGKVCFILTLKREGK